MANIDQTPVHNLAAERACGKIDYVVQDTQPVSRQMILQRYGIIIIIIIIIIFILVIIIIIINISSIIITIAGARS